MTRITLETLRADFEAKRDLLAINVLGADTVFADVDEVTTYRFDSNTNGLRYEAINAAETFVVARDHGLEAAMLFKLSDGAVDPRGAA